jgi:hypothetical protein
MHTYAYTALPGNCMQQIGSGEFAAATLALLAVGRYAPRATENQVKWLCMVVVAAFHSVYLFLVVGSYSDFLSWDQLRQGISPLTVYASTQTLMEFLLPPYWFTQVCVVWHTAVLCVYTTSCASVQQ